MKERNIYLNPLRWEGDLNPPPAKDVRWIVFGLLFFYLGLGVVFLGFNRSVLQIAAILGLGAILDIIFNGLFRGKWIFPLSGLITCSSLAILLNYAHGFTLLWIPVFIAIVSKHLISYKGKHFFNPSLLAICVCLLFFTKTITLAPAYQWFGTSGSSWFMLAFVGTAAIFLFVSKIKRNWLIISFLLTYIAQSALRAWVLQEVIPFETIFVGSLTSPAFYLFTFYMITDPATSPKDPRNQVLVGVGIGLLDLFFHLKFSLYTFFFAGLSVAGIRYIYFIIKDLPKIDLREATAGAGNFIKKGIAVAILTLPFLAFKTVNLPKENQSILNGLSFKQIPASQIGVQSKRGYLLDSADARVAHVSKWVLSVGDGVYTSDLNGNGYSDLLFIQPLKSTDNQVTLLLNQGDFNFEKITIPGLEGYLKRPKTFGVPSFAVLYDHDKDGDIDIFMGFGFGPSRLFDNQLAQDGKCHFVEKELSGLAPNSICLSANALDYDRDGYLDLLLANTLPPYLADYEDSTRFNFFDLPQEEYAGDKRMFHFLHASWHNSNNGGQNWMLRYSPKTGDLVKENMLPETRWTLGVGTGDFNNDGWTDLYLANDFGTDDPYMNVEGKFILQQGEFFGDFGLDTYKGMNSSLADFDRNGKEDIYVSNVHHEMQAEGSLLWMNYTAKGSATFDFREEATSRNALNVDRFGWGAAVGDLNLDGWSDIVQANGMVGDDYDSLYPYRDDYWYYQAQIAKTGPEIHAYAHNWADIRGRSIYEDERDCIFLNNGGKNFLDRADELDFIHEANTRGVCLVDLDNDGDLDIIISNQFGEPFIYQNEIAGKPWLGVELKGTEVNPLQPVGAKAWLTYKVDGAPKTQFREYHLVNGFMAQSDSRMLFGFEKGKITDLRLRVQDLYGNRIQQEVSLNQYQRINLP